MERFFYYHKKKCGDKWAMCLNGGKRKIMHFGIKNPDR